MRCRVCRRANRADAVFCDACGARLDSFGERRESALPGKEAPEDRAGDLTRARHPLRPDHLGEGVFVGRLAEIEALQGALEDAMAGRGRLVMLVGEAGIGKTRTAQELAMYADQHGAQVLWGRCYENPGAPPFWPWVQIMRTYVREHDGDQVAGEMGAGAADIAELVPDIRQHLPELPPPAPIADPEQARFRLFHAIAAFLVTASQRQSLMLVLDNLHWADRPSLLLLEFLAHELGSSRIMVLGTYRDMEISRQHQLSETLAELTRERLFQRLVLRGLSREDVAQFIASAAQIVPSPALVAALHTQSEGNPFFLTELLRLLLQDEQLTSERLRSEQGLDVRVPEGVREVIGRRLNRLSPECVQMLTLASAIGRDFSLKEVQCLMDNISEEHLLGLLDEALSVQVIEEDPRAVGWYQFTHVLIGETLYDEVPAARRLRLHHRIAEAMESLYQANLEPYLARLAHHFCEAAQTGDVEKAVEYAERAGARADHLLAYEEAARHYALALQALQQHQPADDKRRCKLLLAVGEAQWKGGDFSQAMASLQEAAAIAHTLGSAEDLARAALGFEEASWRPGLPGDAAARLLKDALMALGERDGVLKARVLGGLTRALSFAGAFAQAAVIGRQAVDMARRLADLPTLIATVRASLYPRYARWGTEHIGDRYAATTELLRLAERAGDRAMILEAYTWCLFDLMELGDIRAVAAQLEIYSRLAEELHQPFHEYIGVSFRAMWATFEGRFAEGERLAQQAMTIGQRLRGQDTLGVFGVQMFTLRREQGRLRELEPAVRHFVQTSPLTSTWRPGLVLIYSELGLEAEARQAFEDLAAQDFADIPQDALWILCIAYLAEVCTYLADAPRAATLYELLRPYDGHNIVAGPTVASYGAGARYLGMLAATMGRWDEAERHFEAAVTMNARMAAQPWLAHSQYQYAKMLLARGRPGDDDHATALLDAALRISRELGMHALEERAAGLLEHATSAVQRAQTHPCGMSQREVEVLRLIAVGKSNRDIADILFISPHTVANHVRNILLKTASANRTEAAAFAMRHGLTSASSQF